MDPANNVPQVWYLESGLREIRENVVQLIQVIALDSLLDVLRVHLITKHSSQCNAPMWYPHVSAPNPLVAVFESIHPHPPRLKATPGRSIQAQKRNDCRRKTRWMRRKRNVKLMSKIVCICRSKEEHGFQELSYSIGTNQQIIRKHMKQYDFVTGPKLVTELVQELSAQTFSYSCSSSSFSDLHVPTHVQVSSENAWINPNMLSQLHEICRWWPLHGVTRI